MHDKMRFFCLTCKRALSELDETRWQSTGRPLCGDCWRAERDKGLWVSRRPQIDSLPVLGDLIVKPLSKLDGLAMVALAVYFLVIVGFWWLG